MARSKSGKSARKSRGRSRSVRAKLKTQKTAAKRVKRTGTGKLRIRHAFKSHLLTRKSAARLRRLRRPGIASASDRKQLERLVPPTGSAG
ncbi:MAG: 50S ribosomal protein L35 [Armatimonadota bacterium]|nr:MAG: 50S ribosomal protein L35 [Armatimonadota bacterium]